MSLSLLSSLVLPCPSFAPLIPCPCFSPPCPPLSPLLPLSSFLTTFSPLLLPCPLLLSSLIPLHSSLSSPSCCPRIFLAVQGLLAGLTPAWLRLWAILNSHRRQRKGMVVQEAQRRQWLKTALLDRHMSHSAMPVPAIRDPSH